MRISYCFILLLFLPACQTSTDSTTNEAIYPLTDTLAVDTLITSDLIWHFENEFDAQFKDTLKLWVSNVKEACFETLGEYPFSMNIYFHKSDSKQKEGVTFGHTDRAPSTRGLHLYVIDQSSYESLISDWIAPHEMSHLAIRPVGRNNKWFAEGFATYLSRRVMIRLGYYSEAEFEQMYATKIAETKPFYEVEYSFSDRSAELFDEYRYSTVYWAGAGFFYWADKELQKNSDMRFEELLQEYQIVGRNQDTNFAQLINSWDKIAGYDLFDELMSEYRNGSSREIMSRF